MAAAGGRSGGKGSIPLILLVLLNLTGGLRTDATHNLKNHDGRLFPIPRDRLHYWNGRWLAQDGSCHRSFRLLCGVYHRR